MIQPLHDIRAKKRSTAVLQPLLTYPRKKVCSITQIKKKGRICKHIPSLFNIYLSGLFLIQQDFKDLASSLRHRSARTEDSSYAGFIKEVIVLCRDYAACNDHNVLTT